jgi:hypothetical protein
MANASTKFRLSLQNSNVWPCHQCSLVYQATRLRSVLGAVNAFDCISCRLVCYIP